MHGNSGQNLKRLEIRKYANRRYYDSTHSRHLTLEEIRALVEQGHDIQVFDARTKADITAQVLMQIILELDTVKLDSLPVPLLVHLIRVNDQIIKNFIDNYLYKALAAFTEYQKRWQEQLRTAPGFTGVFPTMAEWTSAMLQPFSAGPAHSQEATGGSSERRGEPDMREVVRLLQQQVAELQKRSSSRSKEQRPREKSRQRRSKK